jgi:hypothetical protein
VKALAWMLGLAVIGFGGFLVWVGMFGPEPAPVDQAASKPARVCPPQVSIPPRAANQPGDDILGVRAGFTATEIEETVKCVAEDYEVELTTATGGAPFPIVRVKRGEDERYQIHLYGPAGQERAALIWRDHRFDVTTGPYVQALEGELVAKYGPPHKPVTLANGARQLSWAFAPSGVPIRQPPAEGSRNFLQEKMTEIAAGFQFDSCVKTAPIDSASPAAWDGRCGVTVKVEIEPSLSDTTRATRLRVFVTNQQVFARLAPAMKAPGGEDVAK